VMRESEFCGSIDSRRMQSIAVDYGRGNVLVAQNVRCALVATAMPPSSHAEAQRDTEVEELATSVFVSRRGSNGRGNVLVAQNGRGALVLTATPPHPHAEAQNGWLWRMLKA